MNNKFKAWVDIEYGDYHYLKVTHNGYQSFGISLEDPESEIPLIIDALQKHLDKIRVTE